MIVPMTVSDFIKICQVLTIFTHESSYCFQRQARFLNYPDREYFTCVAYHCLGVLAASCARMSAIPSDEMCLDPMGSPHERC